MLEPELMFLEIVSQKDIICTDFFRFFNVHYQKITKSPSNEDIALLGKKERQEDANRKPSYLCVAFISETVQFHYPLLFAWPCYRQRTQLLQLV